MDNQIENEDQEPQLPAQPSRQLRKWITGILAGIVLAITGGLYWLIVTSAGLSWLLATASHVTHGALTFSGVTGSLYHAFHAGTIAYTSDDLTAEVEDFTFRWQPQRLLTGSLHIEALMIQSIEVHSAASKKQEQEPVTLPESLSLPVGVIIEKLGIRSLKTYTLGNDKPDIVINDLALRLDSDGEHHRLQTMALDLEWGKITGNLEINAHPPFQLMSQLVFYSWANVVNINGGLGYAAMHLNGNLQQIKAALTVRNGNLTGDGNFVLDPFGTLPLLGANLVFSGLDPHIFSPDLPKADLSFSVQLEQNQAGQLTGFMTASNASARPLDKEGIPLKNAHMLLDLTIDKIHLSDIALRLSDQEPKPGSLTGEVTWQISTKTGLADIHVQQLNPADIKSSLHPAKLTGNLHFEGNDQSQQGLIKLQDKALPLNMDMALTRADSLISIEKLDLMRGDSKLSGHGTLQLDQSQPFTFEGLLKKFDTSAFADVPSSNLNAKFNLTGQLAPQPIANIDLVFEPGHFANQPVAGKAHFVLQQPGHLRSDTHLRLGDNQLELKGALGNPEDHLVMTLSAPKLAQIGFGLQGDIRSRVELSGVLDHPSVAFEIDSNHLGYREEHRLTHLNARGNLQKTTVQLDLKTGEYRQGDQSYLQKLSLGLTGTRAQHQLALKSQINSETEVQFQARGGLHTQSGEASQPKWDGVIEKLTLTGSVPLNLVTQPDIHISPEMMALGRTRITVAAGEIDIHDTNWTPKQWSTQGNFTGIALRSGGLSPENTDPLKLGGNWQFSANKQLTGHLQMQREKGDFTLPTETPFALGLQTLLLNLQAENNNLNGQLAIRGKNVGETTAKITVPLQSTGSSWEISKNTPLKGTMQLNLPDLSWVGNVLADNLLSEGRIAAQASLAGTLDQPQLQGSLTGDGLVIALLDQGLRLKDGKLALNFNQDRLQLETFNFTAPLEKPSKDRLLKNLKLSQKTGQVNAHGSLDLHNQQSNLTIELDHLPVAQQEDRWIVVSGNSQISFKEQALDIIGKIVTDVGFIKQPAAGVPELADDVVVSGKNEPEPKSQGLKINLDATLDLGEQFFLRASGLEGRLVGQLHLSSKPEQLLNAIGTIATRDTNFEAYGQRLQVRRGIVNFDGPLDNPGLNILAVRTNQQSDSGNDSSDVIDQPSQDSNINALAVRGGMSVEAGVEITGTVKHPKITLVSQPEVPDSEKLSWIVLGRPADKSGLDSSLLLSAAGSILGGTDEGVLANITRGLGVDDISIRQQAGGSLMDQVGSVGKRLSSRAYLSYERGLTSSSAGVAKLTYSLFPHISVVTRAGDDSAVDLFYNFQFD